MIEPTKIQPIYQGGVAAFVVISFADFAREHPVEAAQIKLQSPRIPEGDYIPHEVVGLHVQDGLPLVRAPGGNTLALLRSRLPSGPGSPWPRFPRWSRAR